MSLVPKSTLSKGFLPLTRASSTELERGIERTICGFHHKIQACATDRPPIDEFSSREVPTTPSTTRTTGTCATSGTTRWPRLSSSVSSRKTTSRFLKLRHFLQP